MPEQESVEPELVDSGSLVEAVAAKAHGHHHPADPNEGVVRGQLGRGAVLAGVVAAALTITAVVLLGVAIGGN